MENETDFFEKHSDEFLEMAYDYSRVEKIANPDGYGKRTGDCGDTVEIFLTVGENEIIEAVSIHIEGCANTMACANTAARLTEGESVEKAWEITPEAVAEYLKTLEEDHFHCAELSVGAFFLALTNYRDMKKNGWKKNYSSAK